MKEWSADTLMYVQLTLIKHPTIVYSCLGFKYKIHRMVHRVPQYVIFHKTLSHTTLSVYNHTVYITHDQLLVVCFLLYTRNNPNISDAGHTLCKLCITYHPSVSCHVYRIVRVQYHLLLAALFRQVCFADLTWQRTEEVQMHVHYLFTLPTGTMRIVFCCSSLT